MWPLITVNTARSEPKPSVPMSPMKTFAGYLLNKNKEMQEPKTAEYIINIDEGTLSMIEIIRRVKEIITIYKNGGLIFHMCLKKFFY